MNFNSTFEDLDIKSEDGGSCSFSDITREGIEFEIRGKQCESETTEDDSSHIDKCFEFEEYAQHINLDCITESTLSSPFELLRRKMFKINDDGCVMKRVLVNGTQQVPHNAAAYVHYNTYLEMSELPFDSSYLRNTEPFRFQLGKNLFYEGFEIALQSMKNGEKSQFLIAPHCAFGKFGIPPRIPPDATILLEMELFKFVDCGSVTLRQKLTEEENMQFDVVYKLAKSHHNLGNDYVSNKKFGPAICQYKKGVRLLLGCSSEQTKDEELRFELLFTLFLNIMVCSNNPAINKPHNVCSTAKEAFNVVPDLCRKNAKIFFNLGKAHFTIGDYDKAEINFNRALQLAPHNIDISSQLKNLDAIKKKHYLNEKEICKRALGLSLKEDKISRIDKRKTAEISIKLPLEDGDKNSRIDKRKTAMGVFDDSFIAPFKSTLEEFAQDANRSKLQLPPDLIKEEKKICQSLAESMNLIYQEEKVHRKIMIQIIK